MLSMSFLRFRTRTALKKNKSLRITTPYEQAKSIGVIFCANGATSWDLVQPLVNRFTNDGKIVSILEYIPKRKQLPSSPCDNFSIQDLGFWGTVDSETAVQFARQSFDYIFYVGSVLHPIILFLLAETKAKCRVGCYHENASAFFELMINKNGSEKHLIDNMYKYTRQIT